MRAQVPARDFVTLQRDHEKIFYRISRKNHYTDTRTIFTLLQLNKKENCHINNRRDVTNYKNYRRFPNYLRVDIKDLINSQSTGSLRKEWMVPTLCT